MYSYISQSGRVAYGVKEYILDTKQELATVPMDCAMGSAAIIIEDGSTYVLNGQGEWVLFKACSSSSQGGGSINTEEINALKKDIEAMQQTIQQLKEFNGYKVCGDVQDVADLEALNPTKGDVYNVISTNMNYVWDGVVWDPLSSPVDSLSIKDIDDIINS